MSSTIVIRKPLRLENETHTNELKDSRNTREHSHSSVINIKGYSTRPNANDLDQSLENDRANIKVKKDELLTQTESTKDVVNLPMLHRSNRLQNKKDLHYGEKDSGTIRRPYDCNQNPILVQRYDKLTHDKEDSGISESADFLSECSVSPIPRMDEADVEQTDESRHTISPFPPIHDDEVDKHRRLNAEAEKDKTKTRRDSQQSYLHRLRLNRKIEQEARLKELKEAKKKAHLKRMQTRPKIEKVRDEFFMEPPPPPPPKPKEPESKAVKLVLGFRYSFSIEEYYRGLLQGTTKSFVVLNDVEKQGGKDEVLNGWLVKTLGANVLNLQARTLPSCNPVEIRMRRMQARMRNNTMSRTNSFRTFSRDSMRSVASQLMAKSTDSYKRLDPIEEGTNSPKRHVASGTPEETNEGDRPISFSPLKLPPISSPADDSTDSPRPGARNISLRLPSIVVEES